VQAVDLLCVKAEITDRGIVVVGVGFASGIAGENNVPKVALPGIKIVARQTFRLDRIECCVEVLVVL
jgi:hypothetical protein